MRQHTQGVGSSKSTLVGFPERRTADGDNGNHVLVRSESVRLLTEWYRAWLQVRRK